MRKFTAMFMALSLFLLCGCGVDLNFTGVSPFRNLRDSAKTEAIAEAVDAFMEEEGLTDLSAGIIRGKETEFVRRGEMNEHTKVRLGTMSQMFTGMLIPYMTDYIGKPADIQQVADDWFHSASPVPVWSAEQPEGEEAPAEGEETEVTGQPIRLWHLALHQSGLGAFNTYGKDYATGGMLHNQIADAPLAFEPGTDTADSPLGFALLCETLRMNYNMNAKYVNLVGNQVTGLMDMQNSGFWKGDALAGYDGYQSTAYDLLKVAAHVNGVLDQNQTLRAQLDASLIEVGNTGKTLAFDMDKSGEQTVFFRTGKGDDGMVSCIAILPDLDLGVTITARGEADLMVLADQLLEIVK